MSIELLAEVGLFSFLSQTQLEALAVTAESVRLEAGEPVFGEGDTGEEVYVVVSGTIRIHHAISLDADRTLAEFGPGAMFGEASIIDRDVRSAAATAAEASQLLVFDAGLLREFMLGNPTEGLLIMGRLAAMMMDRLRSTNERLKESMAWGIEVSGAAKLSMHSLVASGAEIDLHLRGERHLRGRLVRADQDAGSVSLWLRTDDDRVHLVPFHAITELVCGVDASTSKED